MATEICVIRVPRALHGLEPLGFEMVEIYRAERRIDEVAIVNAVRAPELLKTFNKAYLDLRKYISLLEYEHAIAEEQQSEVKGLIVLNDAPRILREKNLVSEKNPSGSVDQREAVVALDPRYKQITELVINLKCYLSLFNGKKDAIEKAYTAVKRILPDNFIRRANPNLVVPTGESHGQS